MWRADVTLIVVKCCLALCAVATLSPADEWPRGRLAVRKHQREGKKKKEWVTSSPPGLNKHEAISRGSHWGVYALDMERKEIEFIIFFIYY